MICENPVWSRGRTRGPFPCRDCEPCRINRRRVWTGRLMLERSQVSEACFVTLTYSPRSIPKGGTLVPDHMSSYLKRLRDQVKPKRFRFYGCGEYGELSQRPHYHLVLFGLSPFDQRVASCWHSGFVKVGDATPESMQYVAGYVVKKILKKGDPSLAGRAPEFQRSSNRPGIGKGAVKAVVDELEALPGIVEQFGDVPSVLGHGRRKLPVGRYLKEKMREDWLKRTGEVLKANNLGPQSMLRMSSSERSFEQERDLKRSSYRKTEDQDKVATRRAVRREKNSRSRRLL